MSIPARRPEVEVTLKEVQKYLKKKRLPRTQANITWGFSALTQEKQMELMPKGREVSIAKSDAARQVVYGEAGVGGVITYFNVTANNQYVNLIVTLAGHECEDIYTIYLDEWRVDFETHPGWCLAFVRSDGFVLWNSNVYQEKFLGTTDQAMTATVLAMDNLLTVAHRQRGCCFVFLSLKWDTNYFAEGIPKVSAVMRGKKVYDPRTGLTSYSNNAALVIADYLTWSQFGLGAGSSEIDWTQVEVAADICDETVTLPDTTTEARYTINGAFDCDESHESVLRKMCSAIGGNITYSCGKWRIWPAAWRAPAITLTDADVLGEVKIETMRTKRDSCNRVKGTFPDSSKRFEVTDYPPVTNSTYLGEDKFERWKELDLPFTTSAIRCQRLAKIALEKVRQGIVVELLAPLKVLGAQVPETVALTFERYGWSAKPFEIESCEFMEVRDSSGSSALAVGLTLRETAEGVYEWNSGDETTYDLAPDTNLANPFYVTAPTGLACESGTNHLYIRGDGSVVSRIYFSWDASVDYFVLSGGKFQVRWRRSGEAVYASVVDLDSSFSHCYIYDVRDGEAYDVSVRAINALGVASDWTNLYWHLVVGKTAAPSDVAVFAAAAAPYGIQLSWSAIGDLDLREYELRLGSDWNTATVIALVRTTNYLINAVAVGTYTYCIKAIDTTGNYSQTETYTSLVISSPSTPIGAIVLAGTNAVLDWGESTGSFAVADYAVYYGDVFATATLLVRTKATAHTLRVDWTGNRTFWIEPRDVVGNVGSALQMDLEVVPPSAVTNLRPEVIDNNCLLRWTASVANTLPVESYEVRRGDTYLTATVIGLKSGTFTAIFEMTGGQFVYWVVAIDTAGNYGTEASVTAIVSEPPDLVILLDQILTDGILDNCIEVGDKVYGPVADDETWEDHFVNHSWTTLEQKADYGYELYIEPAVSYGTWTKVIDYGAVLTNTIIRLAYSKVDIIEGLTFTPCLGFSADNINWVREEDVTSILGSSFQYVEVLLKFGVEP